MDINLALHAAIAASDTEKFDRLLRNPDVDINYINDDGKTPLMATIDFGSSMAMDLIRVGCDVNCKDRNGCTPLHKTIKNNLIDVAHELIVRGAYIDEQNGKGKSPLWYAISSGSVTAVCLLLYYQADVNIPTGTTRPRTHLIHSFERNEHISAVLLDYCSHVSYQDWRGETAFSTACDSRNPLAIELLKRGASVNTIHDGVSTPLTAAIHYKDSELFKLILPKYRFKRSCDDTPFLFQYTSECNFSNSDWLECFYLILNSPVASKFIRDNEVYHKENNWIGSILIDIIGELASKNIEIKDRIAIINMCLSLGAKVKAEDLQFVHLLFGSNDEFEAVIYAGDLTYNSYKDQMCFLFQKPFNSRLKLYTYKEFCDSEYPTLSKKTFCSLGYFSISLEKRKQYLTWYEKDMPKKLNIFLEELEKIPQFPSLLELSRRQAQKYIEENFKIVKAYHFYDIVRSLKLPKFAQDIILFKRHIY